MMLACMIQTVLCLTTTRDGRMTLAAASRRMLDLCVVPGRSCVHATCICVRGLTTLLLFATLCTRRVRFARRINSTIASVDSRQGIRQRVVDHCRMSFLDLTHSSSASRCAQSRCIGSNTTQHSSIVEVIGRPEHITRTEKSTLIDNLCHNHNSNRRLLR